MLSQQISTISLEASPIHCKITGHHHNAAVRFITTVITEHSIISPIDSIF